MADEQEDIEKDIKSQTQDLLTLTSEELQSLQFHLGNMQQVEQAAQRELANAQNAYTAQLFLIAQNKGIDLGSYTFSLQAHGWIKK